MRDWGLIWRMGANMRHKVANIGHKDANNGDGVLIWGLIWGVEAIRGWS